MADYSDLIEQAGRAHNVDPRLLSLVMGQESAGNPGTVSPKGASGLMQVMPATGAEMGATNLKDPAQNIFAGAKYLSQQLDKYQDPAIALAAYNAGPGAVDKHGGIPPFPETQGYVKKIMGAYQGGGAPAKSQDMPGLPPTSGAGPAAEADPFSSLMAKAGGAPQSGKAAAQPDADPFSTLMAKAGSESAKAPAAPTAQPVSVAGMSNTDLALAGAKKSVVDLGHGISHLVGSPAEYLENKLSGTAVGGAINKLGSALGMPSAAQANVNNQQAIDNAKVADAPLMNTGAGMLGYGAGTLATTLIPAGVMGKAAQGAGLPGVANALTQVVNPSTYKAAAAGGAALAALAPVATGDSRTSNMISGAAGGMAGNALANTIGRIAQPVTSAVSGAGSRAIQVLKDAGIPLDAAQQTGSALLGRIKSSLSDNPFTAGAQANLAGTQKAAFNNAVLNTIGESGHAATSDVMSAAKSRIGGVFDAVAARNPVAYDQPLESSLMSITHDAASQLQPGQMSVIQKQIDNVLDKASNNGGAIDGAAYQNIKRGLDRLSGGQDQDIGHFARQMRNALDDGLERSAAANPGDFQALKQAREQYRNMKLIEGAIDKEGKGEISASRLANILGQKSNRSQSIYGQGPQDLVSLAQAGKNLIPDHLPQSGTVPRAMMQLLTQGGIGGTAGYIGSGGDPLEAAKYAAGGIAAPKLLQILMNNPTTANYLAQGMAPGVMRSIVSSPQTNPLVGALMRNAPRAALQAQPGPTRP